jgi:hypothetical protein
VSSPGCVIRPVKAGASVRRITNPAKAVASAMTANPIVTEVVARMVDSVSGTERHGQERQHPEERIEQPPPKPGRAVEDLGLWITWRRLHQPRVGLVQCDDDDRDHRE